DLIAKREIVPCPGHAGSVNALDFSADGRRMVSHGGDYVLQIWDLGPKGFAPGKSMKWASDDWIGWRVAPFADGQTLAASTKNGLRFLEADTGKSIREFSDGGNGSGVVLSRDGKRLATEEASVEGPTGDTRARVVVWDIAQKKPLATVDGDWR